MALREVILTLLAHQPKTGYEIARDFDQVLKYFWTASHQQVYRELGVLHDEGCVAFKGVAQSGKPNKKVYRITRTGRAELKRWLTQPTDNPKPQYDLIVKLLAGASVGQKAMHAEIVRVEGVTARFLEQARDLEQNCFVQPLDSYNDYEQVLYLALRRGLLLMEAQTAWLSEVRTYLESSRLKPQARPAKAQNRG